VRRSAYIAPSVVLMPSFVNLGAYVDEGTMVDTWATVGSCAQIGKNVHLSGGVGIGGVLEPLQAGPVIIEDNCFIGARRKWSRAASCAKARCLAWASTSASPPRSSTGHRRGDVRRGAGLLGRRVRHHARQAASRRFARTRPLLRRHRQ
jgi:hypothetical protein